jgi:hypothetical protein
MFQLPMRRIFHQQNTYNKLQGISVGNGITEKSKIFKKTIISGKYKTTSIAKN